ncbi:MAG: YkgJ family cysteine cluster protein [Deltaproteobacteria bacterium]|nr:YkgJ family cysteine cluster protein [Deltaproteobacteria bacterium]
MSEWFGEGLPFRCTGCGDCCTGAPGAVWVDDDDVARLAAHLGLGPVEFEAKHLRRLAGRRSLLEHFNGDCEFWSRETRGCTVYDGRPTQCRTYPFWPHLIEASESWEGVKADCEGARLEAPLVPVSVIRAHAAEQRRSRAGC